MLYIKGKNIFLLKKVDVFKKCFNNIKTTQNE